MPTRSPTSPASLQSVYGNPGGTGTLENRAQQLHLGVAGAPSTSSGSQSAQSVALSAAQNAGNTAHHHVARHSIAAFDVEQDIGTSVSQANAAMQTIANLNTKLQGMSSDRSGRGSTGGPARHRRQYVVGPDGCPDHHRFVRRAQYLYQQRHQLVGGGLASTINFSSPGALTAYLAVQQQSGQIRVGTLTIQLPNGASTDLVASGAISSGRIGADLTLRDTTLVQAETQVDQLAATVSSAMVGPDHGRHGRHRSAGRLQCRHVEYIGRQYHQPDLYRRLEHPAPDIDRQRHRSVGAAAADGGRRQSAGDRRQYVRRHGIGGLATEHSARQAAASSSRIHPVRR